MSQLSVSSIQNTASATTNLVLNTDGSTTVALPATGVAPTPTQTGTLWYDASGVVTGDSVVVIWDGTAWVAVGAMAATLAEAALGVLTTKYLSPETGVPKDASGMTGAALLPSGTTGQQPGTLVTGMTRFNTTTSDLEFYTGSAWNGATPMVEGSGGTYDEGASVLPSGTTAQRPATPAAGMTRVNSTTNAPESYINGAWSPIQSTQSGQFAGFRNILINGNFSINQKGYVSGTATTIANQYTLDRWKVLTSGQSVTFTTSGNGNQVTAPAGGLQQVIENVNVGGGVYTLSWTGTATASVNGSPVTNGGQATLPANTQATVTFSGGTVSNAQLEPGSVATPFEQRTVGIELELCQRYYYNSLATVTTPISLSLLSTTNNNRAVSIEFPVNMRATPTATITLSSGGVGAQSSASTRRYYLVMNALDTTTTVTATAAIFSAEL